MWWKKNFVAASLVVSALSLCMPSFGCDSGYCDSWGGLYNTGGYNLYDFGVGLYNTSDYLGGSADWYGSNWGGGCGSFYGSCGDSYDSSGLYGGSWGSSYSSGSPLVIDIDLSGSGYGYGSSSGYGGYNPYGLGGGFGYGSGYGGFGLGGYGAGGGFGLGGYGFGGGLGGFGYGGSGYGGYDAGCSIGYCNPGSMGPYPISVNIFGNGGSYPSTPPAYGMLPTWGSGFSFPQVPSYSFPNFPGSSWNWTQYSPPSLPYGGCGGSFAPCPSGPVTQTPTVPTIPSFPSGNYPPVNYPNVTYPNVPSSPTVYNPQTNTSPNSPVRYNVPRTGEAEMTHF